jgi:hypothetical protein
MKIQEKYSYYLQHKLKFIVFKNLDEFEGADYYNEEKFTRGAIWELSGYVDKALMLPIGETEIDGFIFNSETTYINADVNLMKIRPLLIHLDDLLPTISEWMYLQEVESFDSRESAKNWCEIMFLDPMNLPFKCFNKLLSLHGDVFDLITAGIACRKDISQF